MQWSCITFAFCSFHYQRRTLSRAWQAAFERLQVSPFESFNSCQFQFTPKVTSCLCRKKSKNHPCRIIPFSDVQRYSHGFFFSPKYGYRRCLCLLLTDNCHESVHLHFSLTSFEVVEKYRTQTVTDTKDMNDIHLVTLFLHIFFFTFPYPL